jgi:hypothetical protein
MQTDRHTERRMDGWADRHDEGKSLFAILQMHLKTVHPLLNECSANLNMTAVVLFMSMLIRGEKHI